MWDGAGLQYVHAYVRASRFYGDGALTAASAPPRFRPDLEIRGEGLPSHQEACAPRAVSDWYLVRVE